jgi:hypothetical protein
VESTERPDEKDDRKGYADQPEQKTSTHDFLLLAGFSNIVSELKFPRAQTKFADHVDCTVAD